MSLSFFKYLKSDKSIKRLIIWLIILNVFSYPITAVFISLSGQPSTPINIFLKTLYFSLALIILFIIYLKEKGKVLRFSIPIFIFYAIYSLRLIYDISFRNIIFISPFFVYAYFFGATLFPILVILFSYKYINYLTLTKYIFYILFLANISILIYVLFFNNASSIYEQLGSRGYIQSEGNDSDKGAILNPILIGYYGASLALLSFNLFFYQTVFRIRTVFLILALVMGLFLILFGASRGPLFNFLVLLVLSLFVQFYRKKNKAIFAIKSIIYISILTLLLYNPLKTIISNENFSLFLRVTQFIENRNLGEKEDRDYQFEGAIRDFIESPLIGKQYISTFDRFYPHNIFLEVFMATGIIGGFFFIIYLFYFFKSSYIVFSNKAYKNYTPFVFVGLFCFGLGLTSGGLFVSPDIWILMILVTVIPFSVKFSY